MKYTLLVSILFLFIVFCGGNRSYGQQSIISMVDSFCTAQAAQGKLMGDVLIATGDNNIYNKSFGYRDIEHNQPNTDSSLFAIGGITNTFTATAILQLKEKHLLKLDDRFAKYFPDFPFHDVTIRQLLSHTSGLPAYELLDSQTKVSPGRIFFNEDIIPALKRWHHTLDDAGLGWHYSAMNYSLLALLIEKLSDMKLADYFRQHIFEPAGMNHSYLENYPAPQPNNNRTINYQPLSANSPQLVNVDSIPGEHRMVYNWRGLTGSGGVVTTTGDMSAFDEAYFSGKLISRESIDEAITPTKLINGRPAVAGTLFGQGVAGYGLGWNVGMSPAVGGIVWHASQKSGIAAMYAHVRGRNQTIIILENMRGTTRVESITATVLNLVNNLPTNSRNN